MKLAYQVVASDESPMKVVSPQVFADALEQMKSDSRSGYLTFYSAQEIQSNGMIPLLGNSGKTGVLIWRHDGHVEAASLFNNSNVQGAGMQLLNHVLDEYGVNYVNAFEPLNTLYESLGFRTVDKDAFDPKYAPDDWDYASHGRPSVHYMER